MVFKVFFFILILNCSLFGADSCKDLYFNFKNRIENLKIKDEFGKQVNFSEIHVDANTVKVLDENGKYVVFMDYEVDHDRFIVGLIDVPLYKGQGVGSTVYKYVLDFNPQIKSIEGLLASDNEVVFNLAKKRGLSNIEALQETPAFKMRAKLGFPKINMQRTMIKLNEKNEISYIKLVQEKN